MQKRGNNSMYTFHYHPSVIKIDIPKLGGKEKKMIKSAIEKKLTDRPDLFGIPLRADLSGLRKLRVANHRILFRIDGKKVKIFLIEHRAVAYIKIYKRI